MLQLTGAISLNQRLSKASRHFQGQYSFKLFIELHVQCQVLVFKFVIFMCMYRLEEVSLEQQGGGFCNDAIRVLIKRHGKT